MSNEAFKIQLEWQPQGKPFTYNDYSREHIIRYPGKPDIVGTAAPAYKGDPNQYNPEELMVASLSGCHMLYYLALAANSKITVLSYQDEADGNLEPDAGSFKFKEVTLRPRITISSDSDQDKAVSLHDKAHQMCFIAKSVNFPVHVQPEITVG